MQIIVSRFSLDEIKSLNTVIIEVFDSETQGYVKLLFTTQEATKLKNSLESLLQTTKE